MSRRLAVLIALLAFAQTPAQVLAQASSDTGTKRPPASATQPTNKTGAQVPSTTTSPNPDVPGAGNVPDDASAANPQPQIIVTNPPPAPDIWNWHDRVLWGAYVILAVLGYFGIMSAMRALKHIKRHTESGAATAQAALEAAHAALTQTQAIIDSERPWIVIRVEASLTKENSFKVMATNRGRTPAKIFALLDQVRIAVDETQLPESPEYATMKAGARPEPVVLLPSESVAIRIFSRDDVRSFCQNDEEFEKVKLWEKNIFLHGRVTYRDMISIPEKPPYETDWCYWCIHGEKKSAMTIAGPPNYNKHS